MSSRLSEEPVRDGVVGTGEAAEKIVPERVKDRRGALLVQLLALCRRMVDFSGLLVDELDEADDEGHSILWPCSKGRFLRTEVGGLRG